MKSNSAPDALDLSVMGEHTRGDRALEAELLSLFEAQCLKLYPVIAGSRDPVVRAEAAHTLRGGAAALGAERVVRLSAALEDASRGCVPGEETGGLVIELGHAIEATRSAIATWRKQA